MSEKECYIQPVETPAAVAALAAEVLDPRREHPLVCLTSRPREREPALDPEDVREIVGPDVPIFSVPTGDLTRVLQESLPPMFHVFGGAARIWWPGVSGASTPGDHPLIQDHYKIYGSKSIAQLRVAFQRGAPRVDSSGSKDPRVTQLTAERDVAVNRERQHAVEVARLNAELHQAKRSRAEARRLLSQERKQARDDRAIPQLEEPTLDPDGEFHISMVREWAATGPAGRRDRPLASFRLGAEFLASVDNLADVPLSRIANVCARVASGTAHGSDGLQVHPLRRGHGGSDPQRTRGDGAKAWRCAVKRGTPSAPRLHWWVLLDGTIEFAQVVRHDEYKIQE